MDPEKKRFDVGDLPGENKVEVGAGDPATKETIEKLIKGLGLEGIKADEVIADVANIAATGRKMGQLTALHAFTMFDVHCVPALGEAARVLLLEMLGIMFKMDAMLMKDGEPRTVQQTLTLFLDRVGRDLLANSGYEMSFSVSLKKKA